MIRKRSGSEGGRFERDQSVTQIKETRYFLENVSDRVESFPAAGLECNRDFEMLRLKLEHFGTLWRTLSSISWLSVLSRRDSESRR